ncbi:MAG: phosphatidate cytidylyltransferase [Terriglobales bacterium]
MKRVITAAVLIPLVLVAVFRAPLWLFTAIAGLVALLAMREYLDLVAAYGANPFRAVVLGFTSLSFAFLAAANSSREEWNTVASGVALGAYLGTPLLLLMLALRRQDLRSALPDVALASFALPYVALPVALVVGIRAFPAGWFFVLLLFLAVWTGDIAAYYVGSNFGKHRMSPVISPKKTWEGAVASVVASVVVALILSLKGPGVQAWLGSVGLLMDASGNLRVPALWVPVVLGVGINIAAQLGDLVESLIKRGAGVKDSGSSLPGHGGMLDRIDALLLASPAAVVLFGLTLNQFLVPS